MSFDVTKYTGLEYGESVPIIESVVPEAEFATYCQRTREQFTVLAKRWEASLNTEWFARHYLAMKMFLAATVMMTSSRYAAKKNIKIVEPYLLYYAALSCCRAVVFTIPEQVWDGRLHEMSHSKTLNVAVDAVSRLSKTLAVDVNKTTRKAQEQREMFSYKFPAEGIPPLQPPADWTTVRRICSLLGEIAQLRSEILHAAVEKYGGALPPLDASALTKCFEYPGLTDTLVDMDDLQRVSFWQRQKAGPYNLNLLATEGLVEDYFGSWRSDENEEIDDEDDGEANDKYNPDDDWNVIFPFW